MIRGGTIANPTPADSDTPQARVCLEYYGLWRYARSKHFEFQGVILSDALTLENLRELTAARAIACGEESQDVRPLEERMAWCALRPPSLFEPDLAALAASATVCDALFEAPSSLMLVVWFLLTSHGAQDTEVPSPAAQLCTEGKPLGQ